MMTMAGAAAGISAVFKAPLTIFALEVPYKDDLAHQALVPSLISSVVSYVILVSVRGVERLFPFTLQPSLPPRDRICGSSGASW